jgi:hypothetical protein
VNSSLEQTAGQKFEGFTDVDDESVWDILLKVNISARDERGILNIPSPTSIHWFW